MISTVVLLSSIISGTSLKQTRGKVVELGEDGESRDVPGRNASLRDGPFHTMGVDSAATFDETKASMQVSIKAKEVSGSVSHDLDGNFGTTPDMTAVSRSSLARSQQWSDSAQRSSESDESSGYDVLHHHPSVVLLLVLGGLLVGFTVLQSMKEGAKEQSEPLVTASSISLGVKARPAPSPLPNGITEVDVLETFDSYDKTRKGFITRDVLEGLLGPDEIAQGKALASISEVDKLFYHDFRKLVLLAGPVQNAVLNSASRKKGAPIELSSMNQCASPH